MLTFKNCLFMKKLMLLLTLFSFIGMSAFAQRTVTGTVTDDAGAAMPGVAVSVKGTTVGTMTKDDGTYSINAPEESEFLVFSYIGMQTQEVAITGDVVNVTMQPSDTELDEVVVTALGLTRDKKALGYSVQEVGGDDLAEAKETNIVNSLSGKVAGIQVTNASGAVGSSSRIVIRGNSSFTNNQPLWVVDGVPVSNSSTAVDQWGGQDFGNAAMDIDPGNIESVSVLKGANAAALYGSRAANGVVLIKTKSGAHAKKGIGISVSSAITFDNAYMIPNYQNGYGQGFNGSELMYVLSGAKDAGYTYQEFANGTFSSSYGFSYYDGNNGGVYDGMDESWGPRLDIGLEMPQFDSPLQDPNDPDTRQATPWVSSPDNVKNFFQTGITYDNSVSITSGGESGSMRLSLSQQDITGTIPNTDMTKNSVSFNGTQNLSDWLSATITANYVKNSSDNLPGQGYGPNNVMQSLGGWFGRQVNMEALEENWDTYNVFGNPYNWNTNYHNNPYWTVFYNTTSRNRDRVFGKFSVDAKLADWLTLTGRVGTDFLAERRKHVEHSQSIDFPYGMFWQNRRTDNELNADLLAKMEHRFGDISVNGLLGANYRRNDYHFSYLEASELTVPDLNTISNVQGNPTTNMYDEVFETNSVFGQVSFGWNDALYLDVTARNDWSSTLPSDNWSYFYPSFTASAILTELLDVNSNVLSYLKLRGGWAQVGNDTDPYQLAFTFEGSDPFGGITPFFTTRSLPAVDLQPEDIKSTEIGLDARFINNRINLDLTVYQAITTNQILPVEISTATGFNSILINAGEIENKGIEVQLGADILRNPQGFSWNMTLNWAKNQNQVNELYGDLEAYTITSSWNGVSIEARPGEPFGAIRANAFLRDSVSGEKVIGSNGLPIPAETPQNVGNITPDWTGGLRNTFSYKNISLSVLIDGRKGGDIFSVSDWFGAYAGLTEETAAGGIREHGMIVEGVNEDGEPNDIVVAPQSYFGGYWGLEENSIIDGSYIKLREAVLTYKLPSSVMNNVGFIQSAGISIVGRNLAMLYTHWTNDVGIDPETGFGTGLNGIGLEQFQLPTSRTIGFRINLTF
jgi:TonB-linked SusC/RagA family outer membrane protein